MYAIPLNLINSLEFLYYPHLADERRKVQRRLREYILYICNFLTEPALRLSACVTESFALGGLWGRRENRWLVNNRNDDESYHWWETFSLQDITPSSVQTCACFNPHNNLMRYWLLLPVLEMRTHKLTVVTPLGQSHIADWEWWPQKVAPGHWLQPQLEPLITSPLWSLKGANLQAYM